MANETVYVYKEYNDRYAYGEELIEVFRNLDDAKSYLKERVENHYEMSWNEIYETYVEEDDTFNDDYVSICDGGDTSFWIVEERKVHENK